MVRLAIYVASVVLLDVLNPGPGSGAFAIGTFVGIGLIAGFLIGRSRAVALSLVWVAVLILPQRTTTDTERDLDLAPSLFLTLAIAVPAAVATLLLGYGLRRLVGIRATPQSAKPG